MKSNAWARWTGSWGGYLPQPRLQLLASADTQPGQVTAIGSHGQTIRHRPPSGAAPDAESFTLQIGDPNTIAEATGITTVADFRRRDIAAGGEGAPLAPAFHAATFAKEGVNRAIVNIGGIANATLLQGLRFAPGLRYRSRQYPAGPLGRTPQEYSLRSRRSVVRRGRGHTGTSAAMPAASLLRAVGATQHRQGNVQSELAGRRLDAIHEPLPQDVQATLAELTATSIANGVKNSGLEVAEVYICGGGAHNRDLMSRLQRKLAPAVLDNTSAIGHGPGLG